MKGLFHECKSNVERMAERVPDINYQQLHHFISESQWDGLAVMGEVARKTAASFALLGSGSRGLLLDESGWEKSGKKSVGVSRQYIGNVGKVTNAQVGVFAALCQGEYVGLVGSRLYLPQEWTKDAARCKEAKVPPSAQGYRSKPQLAVEILQNLPSDLGFDWVGGDAQYGNSPELRQYLEDNKCPFVLDVGENLGVYLLDPQPFVPAKPADSRGRTPSRNISEHTPILLKNLLQSIEKERWQVLHYRDGTKGKLQRKAVLLPVWVWKAQHGQAKTEPLQLLISSELDGSEVKFSLCWQPDLNMDTPTALFRQMQRYWVERAFQDVKEQLGLHQYQVRSYIAWYHHIALTMMALHFILNTRIEEKEEIPLLSTPDVKILLAKKLQNNLNDPIQNLKALLVRHQQRAADKFRYYLRI